jgi:hypothetical protein
MYDAGGPIDTLSQYEQYTSGGAIGFSIYHQDG